MSGFRLTVIDCEGHGLCYTRCPGLFRPDDSGYSEVVSEVVPDELLEEARLAASLCPERAIHLDEI